MIYVVASWFPGSIHFGHVLLVPILFGCILLLRVALFLLFISQLLPSLQIVSEGHTQGQNLQDASQKTLKDVNVV